VGLNVVEALLARGDEVVVLDRGALPDIAARILASHRGQLDVIEGDVLDQAKLSALFDSHNVRRIVHCAAITSGAEREARDPGAIVNVNLRGMVSVLSAARERGIERVVYTSSGAAYGATLRRLTRIYEDSAPSVPETLYAITKFAAERLALRLKQLWGLDVVCARLGTVVGPWERATGVRDNFGTHSQLARLALAGETAVLTSQPVRRDWVYSRDVAAGLLALLDAPAPRHFLYHLSSGADWNSSVVAWCEALQAAYPAFKWRIAATNEAPTIWYTDSDRYPMDIGRISHELGFSPRYPPQEAFADFIAWLARAGWSWYGA
jgi:nucleoside-diphosphate-sugar epimerase